MDTKSTKDTKTTEWPPWLEKLGQQVVDSAFKVHKKLGPGLLESIYETCLVRELSKRNIEVGRQVSVPVFYDGERLETALKLDLLVGGAIVVEVKAVEKVIPLHQAQLLTYLRLSQKRVGFLINFDVKLIRDGIHRIVLKGRLVSLVLLVSKKSPVPCQGAASMFWPDLNQL